MQYQELVSARKESYKNDMLATLLSRAYELGAQDAFETVMKVLITKQSTLAINSIELEDIIKTLTELQKTLQ